MKTRERKATVERCRSWGSVKDELSKDAYWVNVRCILTHKHYANHVAKQGKVFISWARPQRTTAGSAQEGKKLHA